MRLSRVLVFCGLLALVAFLFAACGGSGGGSHMMTVQPLMVTSSSPLPQGTVNNSYAYVLNASGGTAPYTWAISSGSLPTGLTLDTAHGLIMGTPTAFGAYNFTAQVTDSAGHTATAMLSVYIEGALVITCNACLPNTTNPPRLASGSVGVMYPPAGTPPTFTASGGMAPYTWCIVETSGMCDDGSGGALPAGLRLTTDSNDNGVISGTPTSQPAAPITFNVQVADSETIAARGTAQIGLTILSIVTMSLPNGIINQQYKAANGSPVEIFVSGGMNGAGHPYTWSISAGSLPPGLSLCTTSNLPNCQITGTPTQLGQFSFTVTVMDGEVPPATASANLSIDVTDSTLRINTSSLPQGYVSLPYNAVLQATGGDGNYTWSMASGSLPAGMSLNSTTGAISGTPTGTGSSTFTVQVQDGENPPQMVTSGSLTITVKPAISNGTLNGIYVFSFNGYAGQNSSPVIMAGALMADGMGGLAGEFDLNNGTGESNGTCFSGIGKGPQPQTLTVGSSYSIQPNGLGTMTMVTSSGTYNFHVAIRPDGSGTLIQDNSDPQTRGSGTLIPQASGVNISQLDGDFVLGLIGGGVSGERYAAAGQLVVEDTNGDVGPSPLDVDDGGTTSQQSFRGTMSTSFDSLGRGCFATFNFNGQHNSPCATAGGGPNAYCYAYYLVSGNKVVLISTDPLGGSNNAVLTLWSGLRQSSSGTGFNNGSLTPPSIVQLNARDASGSSDTTAGIFVGQGSSTHTCPTMDPAAFTFDQNQSGSGPGAQAQTATGTYCVTASTGRVTLSGFSAWTSSPPVLYLGGADPGFAVGTDTGVTAGGIQVQGAGPFSDVSVFGAYWGGTFMPAASIVTDSVVEIFADGAGDITGTEYTSTPLGPGGPDQVTLTYSVDSTGRTVVTDQRGHEFGVLYIVGPNNVVFVPNGNNPTLSALLNGQ